MLGLIDELPAAGLALLLLAGSLLAAFAGRRLRRRLNRDESAETGYATTACVSLLTLLISFTFAVALNRYDARRDLVVEEAAACFALWQRLELQPAPQRAAMVATLADYVDERLAWARRGPETDRNRPGDELGDALMERMWDLTREAGGDGARLRLMADALTRVDDAAWRREAIAREHIPLSVIDALAAFLLLTAFAMGYSGAAVPRLARPAHLVFFMLAAGAIGVVIDLDRPRSGLVQVSQAPMRELAGFMAREQAGAVSRPRPAKAIAPLAAPAPDASTPRD